MKVEDTAGKERRATVVREATYVEAAQRGENQWWRYLLGLLVILFSWLVVGSVASFLVAFVLGGQIDPSGLGPAENFLFVFVGFPFFFAGILIAVTLVHRRHPRTLITSRDKISWRRVGQGFAVWFVLWCLIAGMGQYLLYPDIFCFNFDFAAFALFVPLALVFTAIQTTTEELFYRGYVVQGASLVWANRVFLALFSALIFTLPHLLNPEASAGGWLTVFTGYFVGTGLVWAVVSLIDGTTELTIGAHFANNIAGALLINTAGSTLTAPALFTVSEYNVVSGAISTLAIAALFLVIIFLFFGRKEAPEPIKASPEVPSTASTNPERS